MLELPMKRVGKLVFQGSMLCLSIAAPLLLMAGYLSYSRSHWLGSEGANFDLVALIVSLALGTIFLFGIPMRLWVRLGTLILYVVAGGFALVLFTLYYVCYKFNACL